MFQRLLICTDFEDGLHRLVKFVPSIAAGGVKKVVFLHTIPLQDDREIPRQDVETVEAIRERLSPALQNIPDGIDVDIDVQWGRPNNHILKAVKANSIDLILLGTPNRTRLTEKLFGSTTMELCRQTTVPVMILRPQLVSTYTEEELDLRCRHLFRYLLLPYDGSDAAVYSIVQVKKYAADRPSHSFENCFLCWVFDDVSRSGLKDIKPYQLREAQEKLAAIKSDLEELNLGVETLVCEGNPIGVILDAAQEYDISAIALSSDSLGKLIEWSIPSFAGELLRRSWHPVIYFPPSS